MEPKPNRFDLRKVSRRSGLALSAIAIVLLVMLGAGVYWATSSGLFASRTQSIAVLEFELAGLSPSRSTSVLLAQRLVEMISQLSIAECSPAVLLRDDLVHQGVISEDALITDAVASEIARKLGLSALVVGTATFTDGVHLSIRLVGARRRSSSSPAVLSARTSTEARDRMGIIVYQLLGETDELRNLPPVASLTWSRSPSATAQPVPRATLFRDEEITLSGEESRDPDGKVLRYEWDLTGDGQVNTTQVIIATRMPTQVPGLASVALTVEDNMGARTTETIDFLVLAEDYSEFRDAKNIAPVAIAEFKREIDDDMLLSKVLIGEPVTLDARASSDPDGQIVRYEWDVHANGIVDSVAPVFTTTDLAKTAGTAAVVLTVVDDLGARSSVQIAVDVAEKTYLELLVDMNAPPVARADLRRGIDADIRPPQLLIGEPITLDGRASSDPDGQIVRYEWDVHANGIVDSVAPVFTTTELAKDTGTAIVTLTVVDDLGARTAVQLTVDVAEKTYHELLVDLNTPPVARAEIRRSIDESIRPSQLLIGEPVTLDGRASSDPDGQIVHHEWDIHGDGVVDSTEPFFLTTRLTESEGIASVILTVKDSLGALSSSEITVAVAEPTYQWFLDDRNTPPVARIDLQREPESIKGADGVITTVFLSESLRASAEASYDPDPGGRIVRYEWDLNSDGATDEHGSVVDISVLALTRGKKTLTLTVTDDIGTRSSQSLSINVLSVSLEQKRQAAIRRSALWGGLVLVGLAALTVIWEASGY